MITMKKLAATAGVAATLALGLAADGGAALG